MKSKMPENSNYCDKLEIYVFVALKNWWKMLFFVGANECLQSGNIFFNGKPGCFFSGFGRVLGR